MDNVTTCYNHHIGLKIPKNGIIGLFVNPAERNFFDFPFVFSVLGAPYRIVYCVKEVFFSIYNFGPLTLVKLNY